MKLRRRFSAVALCALLGTSGCALHSSSDSSAVAETAWAFQTAPAPCPEGPNDLAGIEGWAPGAGKAEEMGQQLSGSFGSALGGGSTTPTPAATGCTGLSPQTSARFDAIAAQVAALPSYGYDPSALAKYFTSPDDAYAFVRDSVATRDYAGVLRGASGTLMSRAGNPDDKVVLLAALLQAQGVAVRYVHAPLTDAELAQIDAATLATPQPAALPNAPSPTPVGSPDPEASTRLSNAASVARSALDDGVRNAVPATDALLSMLSSSGHGLAADSSPALARIHAVERDHWWLQAQIGGNWVDRDPTLRSLQAGSHLGSAPQDPPVDTLPDARYATVTLRVIADELNGATLTPVTLVERTIRSSDAYGVPLVVRIAGNAPDAAHIAQSTSFTPSIALGSDVQSGTAFSPDAPGAVVGKLRMEIVSTVPGHDVETQDRVLANRLNAAGTAIDPSWTPQQTAYAFSSAYTGYATAGAFAKSFTLVHEERALRAIRAMLAYYAAGKDAPAQLPSDASDEDPIDAMRFVEFDQGIRDRFASATERLVVNRPQLDFEHISYVASGAHAGSMRIAFDIVDNGVLPIGTNAVRDNVTRGYLDTALEEHLAPAGDGEGTRAVFAAAKASGIASRVVASTDAAGVPPGSAAALAQTLSHAVAIAPASAVNLRGAPAFAWWSVDPASGNTVGRLSTGEGGMAEYAILQGKQGITTLNEIAAIANILMCANSAAAGAFNGTGGAADARQFDTCVAAALCTFIANLVMSQAFVAADAALMGQTIAVENLILSKLGFGPSTGGLCKGAANAFG